VATCYSLSDVTEKGRIHQQHDVRIIICARHIISDDSDTASNQMKAFSTSKYSSTLLPNCQYETTKRTIFNYYS